jgi:hypothetical protein
MAGTYPILTKAGVEINISFPPPIVFPEPPEVVVIPDTYVYVAPAVSADIFFFQGYWWRPWEGRWYRSRSYNEGWAYIERPPAVLIGIPPGWRKEYKERRWKGQEWYYSRIPHQELQKNWKSWKKNRHWEQPEYRQIREAQNRGQQQPQARKPQNPGQEQPHGKGSSKGKAEKHK